ncbi:hypothetical protein XH92_35690 [Bradyrhizobium sp. CCBAU 53421]|nr:hypothetical protein XH92_35690 [Bradyrhizobium sp. CCBAU 53421]
MISIDATRPVSALKSRAGKQHPDEIQLATNPSTEARQGRQILGSAVTVVQENQTIQELRRRKLSDGPIADLPERDWLERLAQARCSHFLH